MGNHAFRKLDLAFAKWSRNPLQASFVPLACRADSKIHESTGRVYCPIPFCFAWHFSRSTHLSGWCGSLGSKRWACCCIDFIHQRLVAPGGQSRQSRYDVDFRFAMRVSFFLLFVPYRWRKEKSHYFGSYLGFGNVSKRASGFRRSRFYILAVSLDTTRLVVCQTAPSLSTD